MYARSKSCEERVQCSDDVYNFLIRCLEEPYELTIYVHDNEDVVVALRRGHGEEVHGHIGEWV